MVSVPATRTHATEPSPPRYSPVSVEKVFAPDGSGNRFARGEEAGERGDEDDEIETDRDSFTPATTTAGRRRLILESAWTFTDHRAVPDGHSLPELIGRYGLTDRLELRLGWNYEVGGATGEATGHSIGVTGAAPDREIERESNASYGLKYQVNKQQSWLPESAVNASVAQSQIYGNYNYSYDGYGYYRDNNTIQSARQAAGAQVRAQATTYKFQSWKQIEDSIPKIRQMMTKKYNVSF